MFFLFYRTEPLPVVPREEPPVPETCHPVSDGDDSDGDSYLGTQSIPYHPRPAAVSVLFVVLLLGSMVIITATTHVFFFCRRIFPVSSSKL